jgi:small nuclear ribonucleoprotein D3
MGSVGVPIKLLNESQGHTVTLELSSGQTYRGKLLEAEDNMNVQLRDVTVTSRDGRVSHLEQVYVRGSHVRLFILPDMLKHAPMFRPKTLAKTRAAHTVPRGGRGGFRGRLRR